MGNLKWMVKVQESRWTPSCSFERCFRLNFLRRQSHSLRCFSLLDREGRGIRSQWCPRYLGWYASQDGSHAETGRWSKNRWKGATSSLSPACPSCTTHFVFCFVFWLFFSPLHHLLKIYPNRRSLGTQGVFPIFLGKSSERTQKKQHRDWVAPLLAFTPPPRQSWETLWTEPNSLLVSGSSPKSESTD